jgi:hypothetical protein
VQVTGPGPTLSPLQPLPAPLITPDQLASVTLVRWVQSMSRSTSPAWVLRLAVATVALSSSGRRLRRWLLAVEDHVVEVDSVGQDAAERSEAEVEHVVPGELVGLEPVDADGTDEREPPVKGRGGHLS